MLAYGLYSNERLPYTQYLENASDSSNCIRTVTVHFAYGVPSQILYKTETVDRVRRRSGVTAIIRCGGGADNISS